MKSDNASLLGAENVWRSVLVCFVAITASLPMAWVSIGRVLLMVGGLLYLVVRLVKNDKDVVLGKLWSVRVALFAVAAFGLSLAYSEAPDTIALQAFAKHGKIIDIALLVCLIRSRRQALTAVAAFLAGQAFFVLSSWIMVAGFRVPWATSILVPQYRHVVFSTYLDQTLIVSSAAAIFWHLRGTQTRWWAVFFAVAALVNVLFFQESKTGYVAALTVLTLAVMWTVPVKWRIVAWVMAPLTVGLLVYAVSSTVQIRVSQMVSESQNYRTQGNHESSSGFRLYVWQRSLQAISGQALIGHGVGSWTQSVKRIEGAQTVLGHGLTSNPHQEFLLWGVELGVGGILLLLAWVACLVRDALRFEAPVRQATLSVVAVMVVACLFNSALYDALIGDFFCITLGLLLALGVRPACPLELGLPRPDEE